MITSRELNDDTTMKEYNFEENTEECLKFYSQEFTKDLKDLKPNDWTNMSSIYVTRNKRFLKVISMGIGTCCVGEDTYKNTGF